MPKKKQPFPVGTKVYVKSGPAVPYLATFLGEVGGYYHFSDKFKVSVRSSKLMSQKDGKIAVKKQERERIEKQIKYHLDESIKWQDMLRDLEAL